jgi:hypothetical protein
MHARSPDRLYREIAHVGVGLAEEYFPTVGGFESSTEQALLF